MEQNNLFGPGEETLAEKYWAWRKKNQHVYDAVKNKALALKRAGRNHWGIANIFEHLRFESGIAGKGDSYKMNNNWRAFLAREIMQAEPELDGFFETREQKWGQD